MKTPPPQSPLKAKTPACPTNSTPPHATDELRAFLDSLQRGEMPDFLQVMTALQLAAQLYDPPDFCPDCQ